MWGLNPFAPMAPDVDPLEVQKVRGLLASAFSSNPMVAANPMAVGEISAPVPQQPQPGMTINPVGRPMPGRPQDYNDTRNDMGNFQATPTLVNGPGMTPGKQILPPVDVGRPMAPQPIPLPPRRPESFGAPDMPPVTATPQQRAMEASSAGKPQDVRPNDPISGFDSGLDKMMTDPLFHMGVALLANPRNPGQGLAAGLQGWSAASRQAKRDKLMEEQSKRKNIHWSTINGQLVGVDMDNPGAPVIIPGGQPQKQMYETVEQDGVKYQRDPESGRLFPLQTPDQPDKYEPVTDESGVTIGQRNLKTGKVEAYPRQSESEKIMERAAVADKLGLEGQQRMDFITGGKAKPAGAAAEKITEGQAKDAAFATRMQAADKIISDPGAIEEAASRFKGGFEAGASKIPILGNMMISDRYRKLDQAQRDFINATLRRESGAMISPSEFENAKLQYFPQPGDDPITLENKRLARINTMEGVAYGGAPSFRKQFFGEEAPDIARRAMERQAESERKRSGATGSVQAAPPMGNALDKAREAISRGAPRDAVIQRLRAAGYDTTGL